jgi:hypothetical protein
VEADAAELQGGHHALQVGDPGGEQSQIVRPPARRHALVEAHRGDSPPVAQLGDGRTAELREPDGLLGVRAHGHGRGEHGERRDGPRRRRRGGAAARGVGGRRGGDSIPTDGHERGILGGERLLVADAADELRPRAPGIARRQVVVEQSGAIGAQGDRHGRLRRRLAHRGESREAPRGGEAEHGAGLVARRAVWRRREIAERVRQRRGRAHRLELGVRVERLERRPLDEQPPGRPPHRDERHRVDAGATGLVEERRGIEPGERPVANERGNLSAHRRRLPPHRSFRARDRVGEAHRELARARVARVLDRALDQGQVGIAVGRLPPSRRPADGRQGGGVDLVRAAPRRPREQRPGEARPCRVGQPRIVHRIVDQPEGTAEAEPQPLQVSGGDRRLLRHAARVGGLTHRRRQRVSPDDAARQLVRRPGRPCRGGAAAAGSRSERARGEESREASMEHGAGGETQEGALADTHLLPAGPSVVPISWTSVAGPS